MTMTTYRISYIFRSVPYKEEATDEEDVEYAEVAEASVFHCPTEQVTLGRSAFLKLRG